MAGATTGEHTNEVEGARWAPWTTPIAFVYALAILGFVWITKDLTVHGVVHDPLFAGYSVAVVFYILARFAFSLFYRPVPDSGYRPTVSVVIPAFNEEEGIAETILSCLDLDYPAELLEVVAINDGSSDSTWERIKDVKRARPELMAIDLGRNYGKRAAMAEGVRRSTGDIIVFVDSDSFLDADAVTHIVAPFSAPDVGAVVGHADVANSMTNWLTKMQQVRYYAAFRVIKGTESLLGGSVTCASGCCSAYRRSTIIEGLDDWEFQRFLGRPATFGDDRALTNRVLQTSKVVYQSTARSRTTVPGSLKVFLRQQLRWKKSWLRESLTVCRYFWRKHPIAALMTYASIVFPLIAPFVVIRAVMARLVFGQTSGLWFYLVGTYAMALLYSLYYAVRRRSGMWHHGLTFVAIYMTMLVFQTYWAMLTMRDNRWGTRTSSVHHGKVDITRVTILTPSPGVITWGTAMSARLGSRGPRTSVRPSGPASPARAPSRLWGKQAVAGLLMLPLTVLPFGAYFRGTDEGAILWAKASTSVLPPAVGPLSEAETAWARDNAPRYEGPVALLVYHGISERSSPTTVSPGAFIEQMATLRAAGMSTVTAEEVALASVGLYRLPPNAVMVSFDDGRADAFMYADPVLDALGMRATMFTITKAADEAGVYYAPWGDLKGYARSGRWDIQSHTTDAHREHPTEGGRSLPALTSMAEGEGPEGYRDRVRSDLAGSLDRIDEEVGRPPVAFAFPFGAYGGRHDDRKGAGTPLRHLDSTVRSLFAVSFNQDDQATWKLATCADDPHRLRRLEVGEWSGRALLERIADGADQTPMGTDCARKISERTGGEGLSALDARLRDRLRALAADRPEARPTAPARDVLIAVTGGDALSGCIVLGAVCAPLADVEDFIQKVEELRRWERTRTASASTPVGVTMAAVAPPAAVASAPAAPAPTGTSPPTATKPPSSTPAPSEPSTGGGGTSPGQGKQAEPPGKSDPQKGSDPPGKGGGPGKH